MEGAMNFDVPIRACVICAEGAEPDERRMHAVRDVLSQHDTLTVVNHDILEKKQDFDVAFVLHVCGPSPVAKNLAETKVPTWCMEPYKGYHPYHAAFYHDLEVAGGVRLPAETLEIIKSSLQAVRVRRAMKGLKLVVADPGDDQYRKERIHQFAECVERRLGIKIIIRHTDDIKKRASSVVDSVADEELSRWYKEILNGPGEMDVEHMRQVARLYIAQKSILEEEKAVGITPYDIKGFLTTSEQEVMPNVSYGALMFDGFLVCEEADIEALTTELLLMAGLGQHPMMSNIYYAFRDEFGKLDSWKDYTAELELADCRQCFVDNHVTVCHFGTEGLLSPDIMEESRYSVRETVPSWPGQSMVSATPRLGPVILGRLDAEASSIHLVHGEADGTGFGDQFGWYRGRWFIRLPDTSEFARRALHHHYVIAPDSGSTEVLKTLLFTLLGLEEI